MKAALLSAGSCDQLKASTHDLLDLVKPIKEDEHLENVITDLQNCIGNIPRLILTT